MIDAAGFVELDEISLVVRREDQPGMGGRAQNFSIVGRGETRPSIACRKRAVAPIPKPATNAGVKVVVEQKRCHPR